MINFNCAIENHESSFSMEWAYYPTAGLTLCKAYDELNPINSKNRNENVHFITSAECGKDDNFSRPFGRELTFVRMLKKLTEGMTKDQAKCLRTAAWKAFNA